MSIKLLISKKVDFFLINDDTPVFRDTLCPSTSLAELAMTGFHMAASHEIINYCYDQLGTHYERLEELISEQAAFQVVMIGALNTAIELEGKGSC